LIVQASHAIEINDLTVAYDGKTVLSAFGLCIKRGEKVVLTGDSGCGKSTALRAILGFAVPASGTIRIEEEPLDAHSVWGIRTKIAYVGQEPELGTGPAKGVLTRPFEYHANVVLKGNLNKVPELMKRFGLEADLLEKNVSALSGGEKQRFALISAILLDRKIFLLDEITSALDQSNCEAIVDYFQSRSDLTVLAVSHERNALGFADRIIKMPNRASEGKLQ